MNQKSVNNLYLRIGQGASCRKQRKAAKANVNAPMTRNLKKAANQMWLRSVKKASRLCRQDKQRWVNSLVTEAKMLLDPTTVVSFSGS
jgi:hypothetical protein